MPNTYRRRRRDSTRKLSRVGGVYWTLADANGSRKRISKQQYLLLNFSNRKLTSDTMQFILIATRSCAVEH